MRAALYGWPWAESPGGSLVARGCRATYRHRKPCRPGGHAGRLFRATVRRMSGRDPAPASASIRPDCPGHQRARGFWSSVRRGIAQWLAGRFFLRPGAMLMCTHNGGIDHHVFIVGIARQQLENAGQNPALAPPAEALVDDFPIPETCRKITPRDARPIPEKDRFDEQTVIRRRAPDMTFTAGEKILDPIPLVVAQCITPHRSAPPQADRP